MTKPRLKRCPFAAPDSRSTSEPGRRGPPAVASAVGQKLPWSPLSCSFRNWYKCSDTGTIGADPVGRFLSTFIRQRAIHSPCPPRQIPQRTTKRRSKNLPEIYPKMTRAKLKKTARKASAGKGRAPLPGVKTDAKDVNATDKCGYEVNRKLAKLIDKAMRTMKKSDKGGQHFVLGWRLYPNKEHPRWNGQDDHACGCGCGCSA